MNATMIETIISVVGALMVVAGVVRAWALVVVTRRRRVAVPLGMGAKGGFGGIAAAGVLAAMAMLGPDKVPSMRRTARERDYADGFPCMLDLLVASVEAGRSLDAA